MDEQQPMIRQKDPGFWRELWQQIRLVFRLLGDREVPFYLKFLPFITLLYLIVPTDLLFDLTPVLGQLDDLAVLLAGSKLFLYLAPAPVVARHLAEIRAQDGYGHLVDAEDDAVKDKEQKALEDVIIINGQAEHQ